MNAKKKLLFALAVIFILNLSAIALSALVPEAQAASYKRGSTGTVVTQIQEKLKSWGYYFGETDGVYGSLTVKAVTLFQQKNGLTADGIAGPATLSAMGISASSDSSSSYQSGDAWMLAKLISAEARGEPYSGQVAVGAVVLNRVAHPSFPNTLSGVIYQNGAFSCMTDGQWEEDIADSAVRAAQEALHGSDPSGGAIYYYNPVKATSKWIFSRPVIKTIGNHVFCS